jgi:threonine aldolase
LAASTLAAVHQGALARANELLLIDLSTDQLDADRVERITPGELHNTKLQLIEQIERNFRTAMSLPEGSVAWFPSGRDAADFAFRWLIKSLKGPKTVTHVPNAYLFRPLILRKMTWHHDTPTDVRALPADVNFQVEELAPFATSGGNGVLALENPNDALGAVGWEFSQLQRVAKAWRPGGGAVFVDGSRLPYIALQGQGTVLDHLSIADLVMVSTGKLSNGGKGACVFGDPYTIEILRRQRDEAMGQSGGIQLQLLPVVEHLQRQAEFFDDENTYQQTLRARHGLATQLAERLAGIQGLHVETSTNMVFLSPTGTSNAQTLKDLLRAARIKPKLMHTGKHRLTIHDGLSNVDIESVANRILAQMELSARHAHR